MAWPLLTALASWSWLSRLPAPRRTRGERWSSDGGDEGCSSPVARLELLTPRR